MLTSVWGEHLTRLELDVSQIVDCQITITQRN